MEVYLLDVGQGTSNVVLLGNQEAIILDCGGATDRTLFQLLQRLSVQHIRHLIISHNHKDHLGGAVSLLDHFEGAIGAVWFVNDTELLSSRFWHRLNEQRLTGVMHESQWHRLERDSTAHEIYADANAGIRFEIFAPTIANNLFAQIAANANATSGVLALRCGPHSIVFGGDATLAEWRSIEHYLKHPIHCDVLAVPHHAGDIGIKSSADVQWLFHSAIQPRFGVVSVGTSNAFGHPRDDVIKGLRAINAKVMCTQITKKCCNMMGTIASGVMVPHPASRSSRIGDSRNVACAGTVVVEIDRHGVQVIRTDFHDARIDALTAQGILNPLCRL